MPQTDQNAIEKCLSRFCDIGGITQYLDKAEKEKLFNLSKKISAIAAKAIKGKNLGIEVAQSIERNYLLCLLTANAVKYAIKKGNNRPAIIEMGMGTGINAIAAFSVCKKIHYVGIEMNDDCIGFAIEQFMGYGMAKNVEIIKGKYSHVKIDRKVDIVINENFGPNLVEEQEFTAADAVLPYTHAGTLFVPDAIQMYGLIDGRRKNYRKISLAKKTPEILRVSEKIKDNELRIGYDILDFEGKVALKQKDAHDYLSHLPVISDRISVMDVGKKKVDITLDFERMQIIVE